jgi:putative ABC transport system permease protein
MLTLCRLLIGVGRSIVPLSFRDDWTREWQAELYHQSHRPQGEPLSPRARRTLVFRCAGAVIHAAWLRKEEWSFSVLMQDVRYAIRGLRARAGFSIICIAVLALGIGANAAVFSVLNGVLLKPLPYREPDRLVQIWETNPLMNWTTATVAPANLLDWRERNQSFTDIAYYLGRDGKGAHLSDATLTGGTEPERVRGMDVSGNFFQVLGAEPALGRVLRQSDTQQGELRAIVLSNAFWRRRFGGDPSVVGTRVEIDGISTEIAGVMRPGFHIPGVDADFWAPNRLSIERQRAMRRPHWLRTVGRLKPGVTLDAARADMTRIAADLETQYPNTNTKMGVGLGPFHDWFVGDVRQGMTLLMGAVALVLLITCTNVSSLLLARAAGRRREIAIRVALGAGRIRLIRQLLTESVVLAGAAGALGLALAYGALALLRRVGPAGIPRLEQVTIDGWVLAFIAATVCATAVLFGLAPAWQSARRSSADALKSEFRGTTSEGVRLRRMLIVAEVALSVVLLAGAGLLLRSFVRLQGVDPGINAERTLSFRITLPDRYDTDSKTAAFFTDTVTRLRAIPGVEAAGGTVRLALEGYSWTGDLFIETKPDVWGRDLRHKAVTPGYFAAAGLPLVAGRDFQSSDTAASLPVVIVNRTLARRYYGDADPVGTRIAFSRPSSGTTWLTVVGVAADEKQDALDADVQPEVYAPHAQDSPNEMALLVRTSAAPDALLPAIKRAVAAVDSAVAIYDVRTMEAVIESTLAEERFSTLLLFAFALTALLLAAIGLYGMVAFTVNERAREIGVRLALGATRSNVLTMVVWGGIRVVLGGIVLGIAGALLVSRMLAAFLFQTQATDPLVLAAVAVLLVSAGLAAAGLPAWRASRLDPAISLRAE